MILGNDILKTIPCSLVDSKENRYNNVIQQTKCVWRSGCLQRWNDTDPFTDINECEEPEVSVPGHRCQWKCVNLPGSHRCICPRGYKLYSDRHHCRGEINTHPYPHTHSRHKLIKRKSSANLRSPITSNDIFLTSPYPVSSTDINECSRKNGGCSHRCLNHKGSYQCSCPASHRLSPYSRKKCQPRKELQSNV